MRGKRRVGLRSRLRGRSISGMSVSSQRLLGMPQSLRTRSVGRIGHAGAAAVSSTGTFSSRMMWTYAGTTASSPRGSEYGPSTLDGLRHLPLRDMKLVIREASDCSACSRGVDERPLIDRKGGSRRAAYRARDATARSLACLHRCGAGHAPEGVRITCHDSDCASSQSYCSAGVQMRCFTAPAPSGHVCQLCLERRRVGATAMPAGECRIPPPPEERASASVPLQLL